VAVTYVSLVFDQTEALYCETIYAGLIHHVVCLFYSYHRYSLWLPTE